MNAKISIDSELFSGLTELAATSFPKKCATCGKVYQNAEEFLEATEAVRQDTSGLKQSYDDDDSVIVELYRNCVCGSTMMDFFQNRRDDSDKGLVRRKKFAELMDKLVNAGIEKDVAREELLKVVRGHKSDLIDSVTKSS